ncbi:transcriptional regulator YeiL [Erwinia sp. CPCC 100877]|nr:transcriptional regulator YeiL [Erwinia sp. CPCC 100877]
MKKYSLNQLTAIAPANETRLSAYFSEELLALAEVFVYEKKDYIVRFDKPLEHLFLLVEGRAKIYKIHENGRRSLLQFLGSEDFIGELSLLAVEEQVKDVQAIDRCVCIALSYEKAKQLLLSDTDFLRILAEYLGKKVLTRVEHFSNNQNYELKQRLAAYMLQTEEAGVYFENHTETAEFLGVSYRHLMYTLQVLQEAGMIKKEGRKFLIQKEKLVQLAKGVLA